MQFQQPAIAPVAGCSSSWWQGASCNYAQTEWEIERKKEKKRKTWDEVEKKREIDTERQREKESTYDVVVRGAWVRSSGIVANRQWVTREEGFAGLEGSLKLICRRTNKGLPNFIHLWIFYRWIAGSYLCRNQLSTTTVSLALSATWNTSRWVWHLHRQDCQNLYSCTDGVYVISKVHR